MSLLSWKNVHCVPVIHGRLAFAIEVRRVLLSRTVAAIAVELPPSLRGAIEEAVLELPRISVVVYRHRPQFLDPEPVWNYVPIQPGDAIVESIRVAQRERVPVAYVDAEVDEVHGGGVVMPDPHMIRTLGLERYVEACTALIPVASPGDDLRERHMAAKLSQLRRVIDGDILFVCGIAHWPRIRQILESDGGAIHPGTPIPEELVSVHVAHPRSVPHLFGEIPYLVGRYEQHRAGFELDEFEPISPLKELLLTTRRVHEREDAGSLERAEPHRLRVLLDYARKLTVSKGALVPDAYDLVLAAKGTIGNDFALHLLTVTNLYPHNSPRSESPSDDWSRWVEDVYHEHGGADMFDLDDGLDEGTGGRPGEDRGLGIGPTIRMTSDRGEIDGNEVAMRNRLPGTPFTMGRLRLERRPAWDRRKSFEERWNESIQCSWRPEDIVIENFRDYVGKRALSLARIGASRSEPFQTSFLDGIDIRSTLRDVVERRIHVKEEPRRPGAVGALVIIFEEDDFGEQFPWRTTWMAEHQNESTLSFYATDYHDNHIGPGIARAHYGGCLLIFPPIGIPDVWNDLRFEQARTPSERLLLAGVYWAQDRYVVHVAKRPARPEVREEAGRRGKHVIHLPLSTFGRTTLERLRRVHVLNGQQVRTWAHRFIR